MREKVEDKVREYKAQRITPAYAGKSATTTWARTVGGDHPRVCGEKMIFPHSTIPTKGSPPRVRGKGGTRGGTTPPGRITPACAGKRSFLEKIFSTIRDHPRVCGEKAVLYAREMGLIGSPPRVRGKGGSYIQAKWADRITPACARKRTAATRASLRPWDHPRVCGEKMNGDTKNASRKGSPPRVRGKVARADVFEPAVRITPACAGKSNGPMGR